FRMHTSHDMHFRNGLAIIFADDVHDLFLAQFPSFFAMRIKTGVRTKIAGEHAYVGRLDMKVAVEISFIAMQFFAYVIRYSTSIRNGSLFKKQYALIKADTLPVNYFFACGF